MFIPGAAPVSAITQMILDRSKIPNMRAEEHTTAEMHRMVTEDVSKITAIGHEKTDLIKSLAETHLDFDLLDQLFFPGRTIGELAANSPLLEGSILSS